MATPTFDQLLEAGCHFGHLKRKWNPAMAPYIFMERNGIHIIDLYKTAATIEEAAEALRLAIARALVKINPDDKALLRKHGFMTRDPRAVERKKPGRPKARKRFQFSKR